MKINIALRFRLNESMVGELHKHIGPDYVDKLLVPTVGSFARIVFSQNSMDDIYTTRRAAIQEEIREAVINDMVHDFGQDLGQKAPWVFVQDVLIREMHFPTEVQQAVNRKIEQYQVEQEYGYRLKREEFESRRKEVEARGIATFQTIVSSGISETYLRWKGIDATLALAQSPNTKVVVIGSGPQNLPLILGGDGTSPALEPSLGSPPQAAPVPTRRTNSIPIQSSGDPPRYEPIQSDQAKSCVESQRWRSSMARPFRNLKLTPHRDSTVRASSRPPAPDEAVFSDAVV
jgi:hypothetical protein